MSSTLENLDPLPTPAQAGDKIYVVRDGGDYQEDAAEFVAALPPATHNHDDRYYTEAEIDALIGDGGAGHNHDDRYYTEAEVDALLATVGGEPEPNGLVSGGDVAWESGLTFRVSAAVYYIGGVQYSAAEQTVTLTAADATNDRIDVLALDTTGDLVAVAGTAAAVPFEPDIDPSTQLRLTFVSVGATLTAPAGVTITNIYLENAEWTASVVGSGFDINNAVDPKSGTKCVDGTTVANGAYALFDKGAVDLDINGQRLLRLFIKSKAAWASGRVLRLQWFANGVARGNAVTLASGYWGFDSANLASYQFAAIPIAQFAVPAGTLVDQLRITDVGGSIGFKIDEITLESSAPAIGDPGQFATAAEVRALAVADKAVTPAALGASAAFQTLTDGATVNWNMALGYNAKVTLGGNRTIATPTNPKEGITYTLQLIQDGTGSRTVTWPAGISFGSAGNPTLSTAAAKVDVITMICLDAATPTFRASFNKSA